MRVLMRNTVFKTAALAGLFLCVMTLAGAFFGITTSAHAIHADEVDTEEELEQFVKEAVDEYYIKFLLQEDPPPCDLSRLELPEALDGQILITFLGTLGLSASIQDLSPDSMRMLSIEDIKKLIGLFNSPSVQTFLPDGINLWEGENAPCELPNSSSFREVFTKEEANWRSGSIYLFVMDDQETLLFHGADSSVENMVLDAEDEGGRDVADLIVGEAKTPNSGNPGFINYCWDDPDVNGDEILDSNRDPIPGRAPGDSWKTSYVVDPFKSLGMPAPSNSPGIIFGSGIYPKTGNPPPGCDGNGMADYDEEGMGDMEDPMEDMQEPVEESMDEPGEGEMEPAMPTSVSGGGCAITAGSDSTPRNEALNLLLIVSALFLAVSFRRRVKSKRNGVQF